MQVTPDTDVGKPTGPSRGEIAATLLAAFALWLLVRPYYGLTHDALLYAATALARLDPAAFAQDFYLTRNASDAYSLFPAIYAIFIDRLGLDIATRALLVGGYLLWIGGAFALCRTLLPGRAGLLALLLVCSLPARYGSYDILAYGEPYLTPRLYAEAICLLAFTGVLRKRLILAGLLFLTAAALHPLMTLPALGVAFFTLVQQDRRWLWLAVVASAVCAVAVLAGMAPFDRLGQRLDTAWLEIVRFRTPYLFLASWSYWNWANLAIDALLVLLAATSLRDAPRRMFLAALGTALLAYAVAALAVDIAHDLLITQLQTWRIGWLLRTFAFIGLARLIVLLLAHKTALARRTLFLFALATLTLVLEHQADLMAVCTLVILLLATPGLLAVLRSRPTAGHRFFDLLGLSIAIGLTVLVLATAIGYSISWRLQLSDSGLGMFMRHEYLLHWVSAIALIALSTVLLAPRTRLRLPVMLSIACVLLAIATGGWDRRSDWTRTLEERSMDLSGLVDAIPPTDSVYWERGTAMLWFMLQRPNYFSPTQGSGVIFSRDAATMYSQRRQLLLPLGTDDVRPPFADSASRNEAGHAPTAADILAVCTAPDGPKHLVLSHAVDGLPHAAWSAPVPAPTFVYTDTGYQYRPIEQFHHYDCESLRGRQVGETGN